MKAKRTYIGLSVALLVVLTYVQDVQAQQWTGSSTKTGNIYREGGVEINAGGTVYLKAGYGMAGVRLSETPGRAQVRFRSSYAAGYSNSSENDFVFEIGAGQGHGTNIGNGTEVFRLGLGKAYFRDNVCIGTTRPTSGARLTVAGNISVREVRVTANAGADFVFEEDYALRPLSELDQFVKENKHLPEIAPATQMVKEGVNTGAFQIQLLQKIEELTLYVIAQEKKIQSMEEEIRNLKQNHKR